MQMMPARVLLLTKTAKMPSRNNGSVAQEVLRVLSTIVSNAVNIYALFAAILYCESGVKATGSLAP